MKSSDLGPGPVSGEIKGQAAPRQLRWVFPRPTHCATAQGFVLAPQTPRSSNDQRPKVWARNLSSHFLFLEGMNCMRTKECLSKALLHGLHGRRASSPARDRSLGQLLPQTQTPLIHTGSWGLRPASYLEASESERGVIRALSPLSSLLASRQQCSRKSKPTGSCSLPNP